MLAPYMPQAVIGSGTAYAEPVPSGIILLEDFENGLGKVRLEMKRVYDGSLSLESNPKYVRSGSYSARLDYDMIGIVDNPSQISIGAVPNTMPIQGYPKKIGMWVYGNNDGHLLTTKFRDGKNKSFEMEHYADESVGIDWTGWRYLEVDIEQGKPAPLVLELFLQMKQRDIGKKNKGSIWVDDIRLIYDPTDEDMTVPTLTALYPAPDQTVNAPVSEVSLTASDLGTGIDPASLRLTIDGRPFAPTSYENGIGVFQFGAALGGGYHEAVAEVRDYAGNPARIDYSFQIEHGERLALSAPPEAMSGVPYLVQLYARDISVADSVYATLQFDPATLQARNVVPREELTGVQANIDNDGGFVEFKASGLAGASVHPLASLEFEVNPGAKMERGETFKKLRMTEGGFGYGDGSSVAAYAAPVNYRVTFAYELGIEGTSLGTESVITVKDRSGAPVAGARIEFTDPDGPQAYASVTSAQTTVYANPDAASAAKAQLRQGQRLFAASGAASGYVKVFLPDGAGTGWVNETHVELHDLTQGLGLTDGNGRIRTALATLGIGTWSVQAAKGNAISERMKWTVVPQLGGNEPEYVHAYVSVDMRTMMNVGWQTAPGVLQTSIQYVKGEQPPAENVAPKEQAAASQLQLASKKENGELGEIRFHKAFVSGLEPGTTYQYRVGHEGYWSPWYAYKTADAPENRTVAFAFVTDSHTKEDNGLEIYRKLMNNAFATYPNLQFVLHGGDLVDNGGALNEWNRFWEAASGYGASVPSGYAMGNHDVKNGGRYIFDKAMAHPDNGPEGHKAFAYSFDAGNAHFISLNSEATEEEMAKQAEWLTEDLQKNRKKWTIAMFHKPAYHIEDGRGNTIEYTRTYFAPILEEMGVDLVLVGHDHVYAHTYPMKQGKPQAAGEKGTVYLGGGAAGWKFYDGALYDYLDFMYDDDVAVYSAIEVKRDEIRIQARTENGELVDDYVIVKRDASTDNPSSPGGPSGGDTPAAKPDASAGESGLPVRVPTEAEWTKARQEGTLTIAIGNGGNEVRLPANAGDVLSSGGLALNVGGSTVLKLSPEQLRAAAAGLGGKDELALEVKVESADSSSELARKAQAKEKAKLSPAGAAFRVEVSIVKEDGKRSKATAPASFTLTLPKASKLTGLYEMLADGTASYVKGKRTPDGTVVPFVSGRAYMLLDYRMSYVDLPARHWAYEYVAQLSASRGVEGVDGERFAPNREVTRAEFAAMLVRELGLQAASPAGFADVAQGAWYAEAVAAAKESGLVTGSSDGTFRPAAKITRQEMAVMIVRAYETLHGKAVKSTGENPFSDMRGAQAWAKEAVAKAHELGLASGSGNGKFRPLANGTRAEAVKLIVALFES